jgi:hypothetical protein
LKLCNNCNQYPCKCRIANTDNSTDSLVCQSTSGMSESIGNNRPDWPDIIKAKEGFPVCNADLGYNLGIRACLIAFNEWHEKQQNDLFQEVIELKKDKRDLESHLESLSGQPALSELVPLDQEELTQTLIDHLTNILHYHDKEGRTSESQVIFKHRLYEVAKAIRAKFGVLPQISEETLEAIKNLPPMPLEVAPASAVVDWPMLEEMIRNWWSFDDKQQHTHSYHSREDFIKALKATQFDWLKPAGRQDGLTSLEIQHIIERFVDHCKTLPEDINIIDNFPCYGCAEAIHAAMKGKQ